MLWVLLQWEIVNVVVPLVGAKFKNNISRVLEKNETGRSLKRKLHSIFYASHAIPGSLKEHFTSLLLFIPSQHYNYLFTLFIKITLENITLL